MSKREKALTVLVAHRPASRVLLPLFFGIFGVPLALAFVSRIPWLMAAAVLVVIVSLIATMLDAMALVTIGSDGVLVRRVVERRFLAFAEMERVEEIDGEKLRLTMRDGGFFDLFTHKDQNIGKIGYEEKCDEMLARIRRGIARHAKRAGRAARAESIVDRAEGARGAGYRFAERPSAEELWGVVDDAAAPPEARARAAAALRREGEASTPPRLMRVAEELADPALAKVMRVVARDEEAEIEAAIAEVEAPRRGRA